MSRTFKVTLTLSLCASCAVLIYALVRGPLPHPEDALGEPPPAADHWTPGEPFNAQSIVAEPTGVVR